MFWNATFDCEERVGAWERLPVTTQTGMVFRYYRSNGAGQEYSYSMNDTYRTKLLKCGECQKSVLTLKSTFS